MESSLVLWIVHGSLVVVLRYPFFFIHAERISPSLIHSISILGWEPWFLSYSVFLYYRVVWILGCLCSKVEPYFVVLPCGLLLWVPWFGSELYAILRSGRDVELA